MKYWELDTPALLIDADILRENLRRMQAYADAQKVLLRPHTKTHKMPQIARMQLALGAAGIAVAKTSEAEVMAAHGQTDILIANEVVGQGKIRCIAALAEDINIAFGVDSVFQIEQAEDVFAQSGQIAQVMIEVEVGEVRCGVDRAEELYPLLDALRRCAHVRFQGLFGHDGNTYGAADLETCARLSQHAQEKLVRFAGLARDYGMPPAVVSYGSTPPLVYGVPILKGITEIRPGTYALMDASQGNAAGSFSGCAATVLASVISCPAGKRVILDVGAKGLTMQERTVGICNSHGKGNILGYDGVHIDRMFDEHAIITNPDFCAQVSVGQKLRVIPVHVCPTCNLYEKAWLISGEEVLDELEIAARGKLQ